MSQTPKSAPKSRHSENPHHPRPLKLWQDQAHNSGDVQIELVPLIDVIFCILTFFILGAVGLSRQQAIGLDLPKASTGAPQMREMLVVTLDDVGQLYVEKQPVTRNQLLDSLKNYHQYNANGLMVLHASRNASYNDVVQVLDVLRQVGGDRVALATLPGEAQSTKNPNLGDPTLPNFGTPNSFGTPGALPGNYGTTLPTDPSNPFSSTTPNSTILGMPNSSTIPNGSSPLNRNSPGLPNSAPDKLPRR